MSQLLSGKHKGRFGAPPEASVQRSPWAYIPIIVLLPLTIIVVAVTAVPWATYYKCSDTSDFDNPLCVGAGIRPVEYGSMSGIVAFTGLLLALAFVLSIVAAIRMKKWPVWVCWTIAVVAFGCALAALLMLNGSLPTPFGELGTAPVSTPADG